jgi:FKBP-type peptidyl-prolyl cis-trans isomerase
MKQALTVIAICAVCISCNSKTDSYKKELNTEKEKFSYAIGKDIGVQLAEFKDELDLTAVYQGIQDTLSKKNTLLSAEEARQVQSVVFQRIQQKKMGEMQVTGEKNKKEAEEFLTKNKAEKGVMTTASGLQYIVVKEGTGPKPKAEDKVKVHYKGTLLDGKEFDSSYKRGEPAEFPVGGVIKGWSEALQLMPVGSKYKLFIPAALAYGDKGAGNVIPPNSMLVFEVELLNIVK